jgi:glycosyltransferase involved in cell wall biosynthesis
MTSLVLVLSENAHVSDEEIFEIDCLFPNDFVAVVSADVGCVPPTMRLTHFLPNPTDLARLERLIDVMEVSAVVLRPNGFTALRKPVLSAVVSRSMPRFYQFQGTMLERYKFDEPSKHRVVFVYPGVFAPTNNGSTQRAFSLLLALLSAGHEVHVIIPYGKGSHNFKTFLKQFGFNVHQFSHGRFRAPIDLARKVAKSALGLDYYLPYFARLKFALSPDFKRRLKAVVQPGDRIIVTYAWMTPMFLTNDKDFHVIVDTHDVNFIRDRNYYVKKTFGSRFLERMNKRLELRALSRADQVLAISEADKSIFEAENLNTSVRLLEPSFDWIESGACDTRSQALNFGFIGSNMIANRLAIDEILDELWPRFVKARPNATLYVAGGICEYLKNREAPTTNVVPLGFVTSLGGYFTKIDALVSPIMMQGGLNFKVIESLCCGVPVLVNRDAEHLTNLSPLVFSYATHDGAEQFLKFADKFAQDSKLRMTLAADFRGQQRTKFHSALAEILQRSEGE